MSSSAELDLWIGSCVAHVQDNASQYFAMIHKKGGGHILWAVFSLVGGFQVVIKRASYLSIATMQTTKAQSLLQMYDQCDATRQFVCWFTLEDSRSTPLTSKVVIIDASRSGRSSPSVATHTVPAAQPTPQAAARPPPAPAQDMQHVLRVALQVADSVATLSAAVDSLQRRVAALEDANARHESDRVTSETLAQVVQRIARVEAMAEDVDGRTRTFSSLHEQMFQQFTQLKRDVLGNSSAGRANEALSHQPFLGTPRAAAPVSSAVTTVLAQHSPARHETRPSSPSADAPPESLSDMIKQMEHKLQRIRLPPK
jgi:hypothetical protein